MNPKILDRKDRDAAIEAALGPDSNHWDKFRFPFPPALRANIRSDVRRIANQSLAAGFAIGALLSSAFWLWLTWGAK